MDIDAPTRNDPCRRRTGESDASAALTCDNHPTSPPVERRYGTRAMIHSIWPSTVSSSSVAIADENADGSMLRWAVRAFPETLISARSAVGTRASITQPLAARKLFSSAPSLAFDITADASQPTTRIISTEDDELGVETETNVAGRFGPSPAREIAPTTSRTDSRSMSITSGTTGSSCTSAGPPMLGTIARGSSCSRQREFTEVHE
mmetsp:Transcript_10264/g.31707  ORF Transcript_10264/g.31707 Transcript_10264/m.31707 type:complete len:206 (+) Transcript_10264:1889-2506(+)